MQMVRWWKHKRLWDWMNEEGGGEGGTHCSGAPPWLGADRLGLFFRFQRCFLILGPRNGGAQEGWLRTADKIEKKEKKSYLFKLVHFCPHFIPKLLQREGDGVSARESERGEEGREINRTTGSDRWGKKERQSARERGKKMK